MARPGFFKIIEQRMVANYNLSDKTFSKWTIRESLNLSNTTNQEVRTDTPLFSPTKSFTDGVKWDS